MGLGGVAIVVEEIGVEIVQVTFLLVGGPVAILVYVFDLFARGIDLAREKVGE